jgi:hypothetical protein
MAILIIKKDTHTEILPTGGEAPVPHQFRSEPHGQGGMLLRWDGDVCLVQGDTFKNDSIPGCQMAQLGQFKRKPSASGRFEQAGQSLLRVGGHWAISRDQGQLSTCCEMEPMSPCRSVVVIRGRTLVRVAGSVILSGKHPHSGES